MSASVAFACPKDSGIALFEHSKQLPSGRVDDRPLSRAAVTMQAL